MIDPSAERLTHRPARGTLIGRGEDLQHLEACWTRARAGDGSAVYISGEAGIGKSRMAAEVEALAHADTALIVRLQCSVLKANSNLYPVLEHLAHHAGIQPDDPAALRAQKIQHLLAAGNASASGVLSPTVITSLAAILGSPSPMDALRSPQRKRLDVLQTLIEATAHLTAIRPMLLTIEDAQWLDPTSQELLSRIIANCRSQRLMVVVTARRSYEPRWLGLAHARSLVLHRLNRADSLALAAHLVGHGGASDATLDQVVERAEGVPLFIEELAKESLAKETLSADLLTLLMSRLDHLGSAKRLAQVAAALGRRFSHDMAARILGGRDEAFAQHLASLMAAEILLPKPIRTGAYYAFRHALVQEAASASLDDHERIALHSQIVGALGQEGRDWLTDQPEIMAHHCDLAEAHLLAANHWLAAGKVSAASGAVEEAINDFTRGLASAARAPHSDARERLAFELNLNLGPALMALKGYASADGLAAFKEARKRLSWSKSSLEETQVLLGLFNVHFGRGELVKALEVAGQADRFLSVGYGGYPVLTGQTLCQMGQFSEARACLTRALDIYDPSVDGASGLFCRADVVATSFLAKVEFALGNLETSALLTRKATDLARQQGNPLALAIAYLGQMFMSSERGDFAQTQAIADEALDYVTEHNLGNFRLWISFHRAALSLRSDPGTAIARMHQILQDADAAGTLMFRPVQLGLLGAAYAGIGKMEEALTLLGRGLEIARATSGYEALPALHRMRAKILAKIPAKTLANNLVGTVPKGAIDELEVSLAIAHGQSALLEELRSATLLAAIPMDPQRDDTARQRLSRVYNSFSQGHDFPDLKHAARVLSPQDKPT